MTKFVSEGESLAVRVMRLVDADGSTAVVLDYQHPGDGFLHRLMPHADPLPLDKGRNVYRQGSTMLFEELSRLCYCFALFVRWFHRDITLSTFVGAHGRLWAASVWFPCSLERRRPDATRHLRF